MVWLVSRRVFGKALVLTPALHLVSRSLAPLKRVAAAARGVSPSRAPQHYAAVVIGSGFGGTINALALARAFAQRNRGEKVLILERGTWWTTPVSTVQDPGVAAYDRLKNAGQPVQFGQPLTICEACLTSSFGAFGERIIRPACTM